MVLPSSQPSATMHEWIGFHVGLLVLLGAELLYARRQVKLGRSGHRTALVATAVWMAAALGFALYIRHMLGGASAIQYVAGYALEQTLSVDNLFVFLMLFRLFGIAPGRQPKVLFWGVAGAIVMRGGFIAGGLSLLSRFHAVSYVFGGVLLVAAVRLLAPEKHTAGEAAGGEPRWIVLLKRVHPISSRQDSFVVLERAAGEQRARPRATVLLLALVAIELTDVVFALDSIPAVLSITRHPFLAYTSNIMAVMGLRSLYFLLIGMLARLRFLHVGLAAVLGFAAVKMLVSAWVEVSAVVSLGVIVGVLGVTVAASLWRRGGERGVAG
ncbi:MAG: TerC/Alx family metal homeostasis membrane protein [Acidobacteriota bacterium]|nr:TerC/Alx family metal homeostasis membrane protein [Acidobacteriota bacterium]